MTDVEENADADFAAPPSISAGKRLFYSVLSWVLAGCTFLLLPDLIDVPLSDAVKQILLFPLFMLLHLPVLPFLIVEFWATLVPFFIFWLMGTHLVVRFGYLLSILSGIACAVLAWASAIMLENPQVFHYRLWGIENELRALDVYALHAAVPIFLGTALYTALVRRRVATVGRKEEARDDLG